MTTPYPFKLGNATILVDNDDFADGFHNGFLGYPTDEHPIPVEEIHRLIVENLSDRSETSTWNTGYIAGALIGLYSGIRSHDEPDAPHVQLGAVTLHLNRWRFRDGYYTGQEDYRARHTGDRTAPQVITAGELLDLIAYRDPETQTYRLKPEEVTGLEDVLGQLVGYVCTALFSETQKEPTTGPLAVVAS